MKGFLVGFALICTAAALFFLSIEEDQRAIGFALTGICAVMVSREWPK